MSRETYKTEEYKNQEKAALLILLFAIPVILVLFFVIAPQP